MRLACIFLALCAVGGLARADGIDIGAWVMQLPYYERPGLTLAYIALFLLIDYALNFLAIGWPLKAWSELTLGRIARELVRYTLWAQVADRVGALLSIPAMAALDPWLDRHSEAYFVVPLFVSKVVLSAIAIAFLVWRYARKRWGLSRGRASILCVSGALLTNPGWGYLASLYLLRTGG
jgi:hypothetical protein